MTPPIHTRFDLVWDLSDMAGVMLSQVDLWQVPLINETVNILGNPYRVIKVGWTLPRHANKYAQYAFVKVQKASDFSVTLGGREY